MTADGYEYVPNTTIPILRCVAFLPNGKPCTFEWKCNWRSVENMAPTDWWDGRGRLCREHLKDQQLAHGRALKEAGQQLVLANSPDEFKEQVLDAVLLMRRLGQRFNSDELRPYVTVRPHHENAWGAALNSAAKQGLIRRVGSVQSTRPSAHARWIGVWEPTTNDSHAPRERTR